MIELKGQIRPVRLYGMINIVPSDGSSGGPLQAKTVYPSHDEQIIAPDEGYYGLVSVTVKPVPKLPAATSTFFEGAYTGKNVFESGVNVSVGSEVTWETPKTHALYNGVRLPKIPTDVQASYPYAWMRLNSDGSTYDLILSPYTWYYSGNLLTKNSTYVWYTATIEASEWVYKTTYTDDGSFNLGGGLLWSNHDIPNGSATATDIYFECTEPVPVD